MVFRNVGVFLGYFNNFREHLGLRDSVCAPDGDETAGGWDVSRGKRLGFFPLFSSFFRNALIIIILFFTSGAPEGIAGICVLNLDVSSSFFQPFHPFPWQTATSAWFF